MAAKKPTRKAAPKKTAAKRPAREPIAESVIAIRDSIRAKQLVNVLQKICLGETKAELTPQMIQGIKILLDRKIPVLRAMEVTGQADTNITITWEI